MTDLVPYVPDVDTNTFGMLEPAAQLANQIAKTEFVPSGLRGKPDAIAACVLFGHEVGIPPMQSLSKIHVIDGRPAMAAELMRAMILRAGHQIWFADSTTTRVTVKARRAEWPDDQVSSVTWTMDDAKKAGLDGRQNWRKYPRAMLKARATSELARDVFPDILGGISYSVEELTDGDIVDAEVVDDEPVEEKRTQTRRAPAKKAPAKKAPAKKAAAKPEPVEATATELPPLPDELEAEAEPAKAEKPTEVKLAQKLVIRCREVGVDTDDARHALVRLATDGRTDSTKDVTSGEADWILELCDRIERQEVVLRHTGGDEWVLDQVGDDPDEVRAVATADDEVVDAELVEESSGAPASGEEWKRALQARGLRVTQALKEASRLARELGRDAPGNAEQLAADTEIADLVWIWAVDQ